MAVVGGSAVEGLQQVQGFDDRSRTEIELAYEICCCALITGAECVDSYGKGFGDTDRVCHLNLSARSKTVLNNLACNVPAKVSGTAVDFRRVFPTERSATVAGCPSVRICDNLASRHSTVCGRSALDKAARGIDGKAKVLPKSFPEGSRCKRVTNIVGDAYAGHASVVLRGNENIRDHERLIAFV